MFALIIQVTYWSVFCLYTGHSRTIVGVEELKDGQLRLLLYDPSCSRKQMLQFINGDISANLMRCLRRSLHSMKAKQYQIVAVVGILNDREFEVHVLPNLLNFFIFALN